MPSEDITSIGQLKENINSRSGSSLSKQNNLQESEDWSPTKKSGTNSKAQNETEQISVQSYIIIHNSEG